ncbi:MAG: cobalamin-dependent protein [Inhella sp.]
MTRRPAVVELVMLGHSGSSSAHATVVALCTALKQRLPRLLTVYGRVHPTYHWDEILRAHPCIDFIVRGEGEQTALDLMRALAEQGDLRALRGIAFRDPGDPARVIETRRAT